MSPSRGSWDRICSHGRLLGGRFLPGCPIQPREPSCVGKPGKNDEGESDVTYHGLIHQ